MLVSNLKKIVKPFITPKARQLMGTYQEYFEYGLPDIKNMHVPISSNAEKWLETLRRDGIVKIEEERFVKMAKYIDSAYFKKLEITGAKELTENDFDFEGGFATDTNQKAYQAYGTEILAATSFKDPMISDLVLDPDITGLCYNYLRRQPYYRNQPVVELSHLQKHHDPTLGNAFHVDNLHQISFMLLVTDQTLNDTHMEYVLKNHKRPIFVQGIGLSKEESAEIGKNGKIYSCTGKVGTLFIFDTQAVHRRNLKPGSPRKIFHCNITSGHHMTPLKDDIRNWKVLASKPEYVKRMFTR